MFVPMLITAYEMLAEHNLIRDDSPIPNIGIVTLLLLDFLRDTCNDFDIEHTCEIVRAADKYGVKLEPREEVQGATQDEIDSLRAEYEEQDEKKFDWKKEVSNFLTFMGVYKPNADIRC